MNELSQTQTSAPKDVTVKTDHVHREPGKSDDIIAMVELTRVGPGEERGRISAAIGSPYKTLGGFWRTPIVIHGLREPTPEIYGDDSFQSLHLAVQHIRKELALVVSHGEQLVDANGDEVSMDRYFREG